MSTVKDSEGNILNQPPDYVARHKYTGKDADVIDWFDTHPKSEPVVASDEVVRTLDVVTGEKTENGVVVDEFTGGERIVLPSAADLDAVANEQALAQEGNQDVPDSSDDGVQGE